MLSFSLSRHSHLHWEQRPEFGESFAGLSVPNFYLATGTSGSNEILLNAWLKPNLFISWALLALTTSLGTLPGSVWSFCHMLVNNIQGFTFESDPHASAKWFHLWQAPVSVSDPQGWAVLMSQDANCSCYSEPGDFSSWCLSLHRQIPRTKAYLFPNGTVFPQPPIQLVYSTCGGLINLWTLLLYWKKVSVFRKISSSLVLFAEKHLHLT